MASASPTALCTSSRDLYRDVVLPRERKLFDLRACSRRSRLSPPVREDCRSSRALPGDRRGLREPRRRGFDRGDLNRYRSRVTTAGNVDVVNLVRGGDESALREASPRAAAEDPADALHPNAVLRSARRHSDRERSNLPRRPAMSGAAGFKLSFSPHSLGNSAQKRYTQSKPQQATKTGVDNAAQHGNRRRTMVMRETIACHAAP